MQLNEKQQEAFRLFKLKKNFFLSGPAGVGKSFLLQHLKEYAKENEIKLKITALTGNAALLINGKTLHSWASIGLGDDTADRLVQKIRKSFVARKNWLTTDVLIIDEVSMLTPELFEKLDYIGRNIRRFNADLPFGGIQIILSGDFFQLPPINKQENKKDSRVFCFESPLWKELIGDNIIELTDIIRQQDPVFQKCLNEIRIGTCSEETKNLLEKRLNAKPENLNGIEPTRLFTKKMDVDSVNQKKLKLLDKEIHQFTSNTKVIQKAIETTKSDKNDTENDNSSPTKSKPITTKEIVRITELMDRNASYDTKLELAIGSQVMLLINKDFKVGLVNGSRGIITDFHPNTGYPIVKFRNNMEIEIEPHPWEYEDSKAIVQRLQIPLKLAWAITIHKSQGASLDYAFVDIGKNIFEYGQSYVALSRIRTLEGLFPLAFDEKKIKSHPKVISFYNSL